MSEKSGRFVSNYSEIVYRFLVVCWWSGWSSTLAGNVLGASVVGLSKPSLSLPINVCLKILMFLSKDK